MRTNSDLYKQDLARWGQETAALLRAGRLREVDLAAVAEELDSLGRGDKHRLWQHLRDLCVWFMAWNYAVGQRLAHPHWYVRIVNERVGIQVIVGCSPSLRPTLAEDLAGAWAHGREAASEETGLPMETFPEACPWTAAQVIHSCFWPMGDHELSTRAIWVGEDEVEDESAPGDGSPTTGILAESYARARRDAARQTGLPLSTFPEACPWTPEQILDPDFFPEP
jgi:Domain of unknown function DUF29